MSLHSTLGTLAKSLEGVADGLEALGEHGDTLDLKRYKPIPADADTQVGHSSTDASGDGRWWKAHEGVTSLDSHDHTGSEHVGGTVPAVTHSHLIPPPTVCDTRAPHDPHTFRQGSRFCTGRGRYRPPLQCSLLIRHEAHYWGIQQRLRCDGHGRTFAKDGDSLQREHDRLVEGEDGM